MRPHSNRGQATVEFALVLPLFLFCVAFLFIVTQTCLSVLALNDTARSAVRAAVTADHPTEAVSTLLAESRITSEVNENENGIITVHLAEPFRVWFLSLPIHLIRLRASASMMREPPIVLS